MRTARCPSWHGQRARSGELESDKKSDGRLCEVGNFVEVQTVQCEVWNFEHETSIFGAHAKRTCQVEIDAASVYKRCLRLPVDTVDCKSFGRIKNQRSCAC